MAMRKRKEVEAFDGSYAGAVLGCFDAMVAGEPMPSELEEVKVQQKLLHAGVLTINEVRSMHGLPTLGVKA
jgi:hypothetical protein